MLLAVVLDVVGAVVLVRMVKFCVIGHDAGVLGGYNVACGGCRGAGGYYQCVD